jgi:hypothetical protein
MRDADKREFPYSLALLGLAVCSATSAYEAMANRYAHKAAAEICRTEGSLTPKVSFSEGGVIQDVYDSKSPVESLVAFKKGIDGVVEQALITVAKNSRPAWHFLDRTVDVTKEMTNPKCKAIAGRNAFSGQRLAYAGRHR